MHPPPKNESLEIFNQFRAAHVGAIQSGRSRSGGGVQPKRDGLAKKLSFKGGAVVWKKGTHKDRGGGFTKIKILGGHPFWMAPCENKILLELPLSQKVHYAKKTRR